MPIERAQPTDPPASQLNSQISDKQAIELAEPAEPAESAEPADEATTKQPKQLAS